MNPKQCWVIFPSLAFLIGAASFAVFYDPGHSAQPLSEPSSEIPAAPDSQIAVAPETIVPPQPQLSPAGNNFRRRGASVGAAAPSAPIVDLTATPPLELAREVTEKSIVPTGKESKLSADFECALAPNVKKLSDTHFVLDMENKYEYMFLFKLSGVAGKTVRIDCRNIPLDKWRTLNPVYRYANDGLPELPPLLPDDYKLSDAKTTRARNGPLLPDTTGQAWYFIPEVWATGGAVLSFVQTFDKDDVTVAMKVPFTAADERALFRQVVEARYPGQVVNIGQSQEGRSLHVVVFTADSPTETTPQPCILIQAREHADEQDSSWLVAGAIRRLLMNDQVSQELRKRYTFLFIPILDPDSAARSFHENVMTTFTSKWAIRDSVEYAYFFQNWLRKGHALDVVLSLHNMESAECDHLIAPFMPSFASANYASMALLNNAIQTEATGADFRVQTNALWPEEHALDGRLGIWLRDICGSVHLLCEVNSQEKTRHLTTGDLELLGTRVLAGATQYLSSQMGQQFDQTSQRVRAAYVARWQRFEGDIHEKNPFVAEELCLDLQKRQ